MNKKHLFIVAAVGIVAGFYLANAPTGTGIYGTVIGNTAANVYLTGAKWAGAAAAPTTPTASASASA